jgi:hypothetical protein
MWGNQWRVLLGGAPEQGQGWDSGAGPNAAACGGNGASGHELLDVPVIS